MVPSVQVRVVLDLEADAEPIRGSMTGTDLPSQPFYGWLELADLLEAARASRGASRPQLPTRASRSAAKA